MTAQRALALLIGAGVGALLYVGYRIYRRRVGAAADRLDVEAFGLELMTGCCAFIVFTSPACRPCKAALEVVGQAVKRRPGLTELTTVDAMARPEMAVRYDVRTIPTVFLITASGHVVRRWRHVPEPSDVDSALALM